MMIVAMLSRRSDRESVERVIKYADVHCCETVEEFGHMVAHSGTTHVVCELRDKSGADVLPAFAALPSHRCEMLNVLLVAEVKPWTARAILRIMSEIPRARPILREDEEVGSAVAAMAASEPPTSGGAAILQRTVRVVEASVRAVITNAVLLGNTKPHVGRLCMACGTTLRSLERQLAKAHLPAPRALLGWTFTLQAMWRIDRLRWPVKAVARAAGFDTTSGLANAIKRHSGMSPRTLCLTLGFDGVLDQFVIQVSGEGRRNA